jgi:hypothetical protein
VSLRLRLIGIGALLCLALGLTVFFAVRTVQAVHLLEQSRQAALSGDVHTIRTWMTIPYISRVYHVPEPYLLQALGISDPASVRHVTLRTLAPRLHRTPDALIQQIQAAILTYRQEHPYQPQPGSRYSTRPPPVGRAAP